MRKTSLVLITIFSLFVTVTIFAQTAQNQGGIVAGYTPAVQSYKCEPVLNLNNADFDEEIVEDLQRLLPVLDSLEQVLIGSDTASVDNNFKGASDWRSHRDAYNIYGDLAKLLFETLLIGQDLNGKTVCDDTLIYKDREKLFSLHHYLTGYYAE